MTKNIRRAFPGIPLYIGSSNTKYDKLASLEDDTSFKFTFRRQYDDGDKTIATNTEISFDQIYSFIKSFINPVLIELNNKTIASFFETKQDALFYFDNDA